MRAWGRKKSGEMGRAQAVGDPAAGNSSTEQGRPYLPRRAGRDWGPKGMGG